MDFFEKIGMKSQNNFKKKKIPTTTHQKHKKKNPLGQISILSPFINLRAYNFNNIWV